MESRMLNEEQLGQLEGMLAEEDAANPAPVEEEPMPGSEEEANEAALANETVSGMSEGDAQAADAETQALAEAAAAQAAPQLPEGIESVDQLIQLYNQMRERDAGRGDDMAALREMNSQLVSIAEALGYGKDLEGVDLMVDESMKDTDPEGYARSQIRQEVANQLKPMLERQQANLRGRLVDKAWKDFAGTHEDVNDLMEDIRKVIGESPELSDNEDGLEVAYHLARSGKYRPEKALFEDADFVERAAKNDKIREKVIEEYLKEVARGGDGAPRSVGDGGTATPTGRKKTPMTLEEAGQKFREMLG